MQLGLALGFVGVNRADVLLGFHLVAALHRDVFEVGIDREILAVAKDDHRIGTCQFGDAGHFAFKDGTSLGVLRRGNVDAIVGHRDFA